jgi:hypothetical protein
MQNTKRFWDNSRKCHSERSEESLFRAKLKKKRDSSSLRSSE